MRRRQRHAVFTLAICAVGCVVIYGTWLNSSASTRTIEARAFDGLQNFTEPSCFTLGCERVVGAWKLRPYREKVTKHLETPPVNQAENQILFGCESKRHIVRETKLLSKQSFKQRLQAWERNALETTNCPDMLSQPSLFAAARVPILLHRIWECAEIPDQYEKGMLSWIDNTVDMYVFLWTSKAREAFINKTLGPGHLKLYNRLLPGAYRADLFRYVIMYHAGGLYSDIDAHLHVNMGSLRNLWDGVTLAIDVDPKRLLNGAILMSPPRHALFLCALGEVFDHSKHRLYFDSDLDISGPGILGECLRHILGKDDIIYDEQTAADISSFGINLLNSEFTDDGRHVVKLNGTHTMISLPQGGKSYQRGVRPECDPGEHYSVLYREKRIYDDKNY